MTLTEELEKYLSAEDPRIRQNAVTALAAVSAAEEAAVERLVEIALEKSHPASDRAKSEIARDDFAARRQAEEQLIEAFTDLEKDPGTCGVANRLLVDLGADSTITGSWKRLRRLRLGWRVKGSILSGLGQRVVWRAIRASWIGGLATGVLLALGLAFLDPPANEGVFYGLVGFSLLLSPLFGVLAARTMVHVTAYFDRKAGAFYEVVTPFLDPLLWLASAAVLFVNTFVFWWPESQEASLVQAITHTALATVFVVAAFATVRGGHLIVGSLVRHDVVDRWIRGVAGSVAGWIALTLCFLPSLLRARDEGWTVELATLRAECWFIFVPLVAAVAAAATSVLHREKNRPVVGRWRKLTVRAAAALLVVVLPVVWTVFTISPLVKAKEGDPLPKSWEFDGIPVKKGFRVAFPQWIEVSVDPPSDHRILSLWQGKTNLTATEPTSEKLIVRRLEPGLYRIEVTRPDREGTYLGSTYSEAVRRLAYRFVSLARLEASIFSREEFALHLNLNTKAEGKELEDVESGSAL